MKLLIHILAFLLVFTSCNFKSNSKDDFYSFSKSGDLWRLPIIEPYEIVLPTNSSSDDWFLIIKNHKIEGPNYFRSGDEFQLSSIKTIGILDSVIVATNENEYWPKLSGQYPSTLILDLKSEEQFLYSNKHHTTELNEKLNDLKLKEIEMLEWEKVKNDFLEKTKLPESWNKQRPTTTPKTN